MLRLFLQAHFKASQVAKIQIFKSWYQEHLTDLIVDICFVKLSVFLWEMCVYVCVYIYNLVFIMNAIYPIILGKACI